MIDNKPNHCETNINEGNNQASNKEDHIVDESLATIQEKESSNT